MATKKLSTLTALQSEAAKLRAEVSKREQDLRTYKDALNTVEQQILDSMLEAGTEQYKSAAGSYSISRNTVPTVTDWKKVDAYILKTKSLDLLHKRLTATAWAARAESGIIVPGVEATTVVKLLWRGAK